MPNGQRLLIAIFAILWALASASILLEGAADGRLRAILDKPWPQAGCSIGEHCCHRLRRSSHAHVDFQFSINGR
jgi:hypothetical protein